MKRNHHLLLSTALFFGLSLSFTACQDNDIDTNGNGNDGNDASLTELEWQKQITLQCLLGTMADVDSLPDNWNDKSYVVTPTIGTAADEAAPYSVRNVVATSSNEAYRIYRSLTASAFDATASNDSWQMDGIGSMDFKVENQPNLYATLKVNIQQLPQLQEIRFVPSTAIGNNGGLSHGEPYYQFGDIVKQTLNGNDTYWVCVRPVGKQSTANDKGRSHWCSFQLTPITSKKPNFIKFSEKGYGDLILPTGLCEKQADGVRMVQNFFNVLRFIEDPSIYENLEGIDDFKNEVGSFYTDTLQTISNIWNDRNLWSTITQGQLDDEDATLHSMLKDNKSVVNAFYHGYTKRYSLIGKNSYKVYNLKLGSTYKDKNGQNIKDLDQTKPTLFNVVTPEVLDVTLENGVEKDFSQFLNGKNDNKGWTINANYRLDGNDDQLSYDENSKKRGSYQFLVKYKTGGQLQERFLSGADDSDPTKSLEVTGKGFTDILVSKKLHGQKLSLPFFAFGDVVTKLKQESAMPGEKHLCILSSESLTDGDGKDAYAYFINTPTTTKPSEIDANKVEVVSEDLAKRIAFQLLYAYVYQTTSGPIIVNKNTEVQAAVYNYPDILPLFTEYFGQTEKTVDKKKVYYSKHTAIAYKQQEVNEHNQYTIEIGFFMNNDINKTANGKLNKPTVLRMTYRPVPNEGEKAFSYKFIEDDESSIQNFLFVEKCLDTKSYDMPYAKFLEMTVKGNEGRKMIKEGLSRFYNEIFLPNCKEGN